jgi:hypothetical protein
MSSPPHIPTTLKSAAIHAAGIALVVAGLATLRAKMSQPLRWSPLQDLVFSVYHNPRAIVLGAAIILVGCVTYSWSIQRIGTPQTFESGYSSPHHDPVISPPHAPITSPPHNRATLRPHDLITPAPQALLWPALAILLYIPTIVLAVRDYRGYLPGFLFIGALAASSVAVARYYPGAAKLFSLRETLLLAIAALAGMVFYLHDVTSWVYSWTGDEYAFWEFARGLLHGYTPNDFSQAGTYGYHPVADGIFQAAVMRVLGEHVFGWKAASALSEVLPIFPLYLAGRLAFSRPVAVMAVGIYLPAQLLIAYAHIGYSILDPIFPVTLAIALLIAARRFQAPLYLFLSGIFAGLSWYTFYTGRFAIGLLALSFLAYQPRSWQVARREVALILGGFVLAVLPFVLVNGGAIISATTAQSALTGHAHTTPIGQLIAHNSVRGIFAFIYAEHIDNHYTVGAMFDNLSAFFLLLGLVALFTVRRAHNTFVLIWYWALLIPICATFYAEAIPTTRINIVLPVAALIAAVGAVTFWEQVRRLIPVTVPARLSWAFMASSIALVAALNIHAFFWEQRPALQATPQSLVMRVILSHPNSTIVVAPDLAPDLITDPLIVYQVPRGQVVQAVNSLPRAISAAKSASVIRGRWETTRRPIEVLSASPPNPLLTPPRAHAKTTVVWDDAHLTHLYLTSL